MKERVEKLSSPPKAQNDMEMNRKEYNSEVLSFFFYFDAEILPPLSKSWRDNLFNGSVDDAVFVQPLGSCLFASNIFLAVADVEGSITGPVLESLCSGKVTFLRSDSSSVCARWHSANTEG